MTFVGEKLRFHVQLDTNKVIFEMLFPANLSANTDKIKSNTNRARNTKQATKYTTHKPRSKNTKKKP